MAYLLVLYSLILTTPVIIPPHYRVVNPMLYNNHVILVIDKPKNWTSFDVVAKLKGQLKVKKIGHAGTLDPLATGVLVVLTDGDTKKQDLIMKNDKEYVAEVSFNLYSPTLDLEQAPQKSEAEITLSDLKENLPKVLPNYIGELIQEIPMYSAKKVNGKPLYKIARQNHLGAEQNVKPFTKLINIYEIKILDLFEKQLETTGGVYRAPTVKIKVTCSSGTYIRTLAKDLGKALNTKAVLSDLVRTRVGEYNLELAKTLTPVS